MKKCIVCDSTGFSHLLNGTLLKCKSCGFITANLEITDEQLKAIYSSNYFSGDEYLNYISDKIMFQQNFKKRLAKLRNKSEIIALEIGCAYGLFGEMITTIFKGSRYTGFDIVPEVINYGRANYGLNLISDDYLKIHSPVQYTHVFMWDVIEHLPRPDLFIEKVSAETKEGAELHITTGNIGALLPRIQKEKWRMIHPPTHLHYFTKKSIRSLLERFGFEIISIKYPAVRRSIKQIFYSSFLLNKPYHKLFEKFFRKIPESWFISINTFDIMHVIAEKKY